MFHEFLPDLKWRLALLIDEVVFINFLEFKYIARSNADVVLDQETGQFITIDQDDPFGNALRKTARSRREIRSRNKHPLCRAETVKTARKCLDLRSASAETAAMLFWALMASGQITMRRVDGWQTLEQAPNPQPLDLAA